MPLGTATMITLGTWLVSKLADKGIDSLIDNLTARTIDDTFKKSIERVSVKLEQEYPDVLSNFITYFSEKEDVFEELIKLLFINQEINPEKISGSFEGSTLPDGFIADFITELKKEVVKEPVLYELIRNKELYNVICTISDNVKGSASLLTSINNTLTKIKDTIKVSFDINKFLAQYKTTFLTHIKNINFIGLGIDPSIRKGKTKELETIFVKPDFVVESDNLFEELQEAPEGKKIRQKKIDKKSIMKFRDLFNLDCNYVILGNPGAGKSLMIKYITLAIFKENKSFKNKNIDSYIPFIIELKKYYSYKKNNRGTNILKYLKYNLEEECSLNEIALQHLEFLLRNKKCILFFDGLDEIFNLKDKITIKNDIENFHNLYPEIRSITTSRYTGYTDASLDEKKFHQLSINEFSEEQIKEYVSKWYLLEESEESIREKEVASFLSDMQTIDENLISNPLLLSLIVILYRNNLKIPESKLEIYQSCTNTLVDKWDAVKELEIHIDKNILQKKVSIFSDLAFWQYEALSSPKPDITYYKAKMKIAESLQRRSLADEDTCEDLAEKFLEYAQKRSIYFDNNFTHKTFLEYFTAYWIYSNMEKKHKTEKRNNLINKYIDNSFWFIVLELLLNLIDKDQADNEILDDIISQNIENPSSYKFLLYVLPSLSNVSDSKRLAVYKHVIKYIISSKTTPIDKERVYELYRFFHNSGTNKEATQRLLITCFESFKIKERTIRFYVLFLEFHSFLSDFSKEKTESIIKTQHFIKKLNSDPRIYFLYVYNIADHKDYIENFITFHDLFGEKHIYSFQKTYFSNGRYIPFINYYLIRQILPENLQSLGKNLSVLKKRGIKLVKILSYLIDQSIYISNIQIIESLVSKLQKDSGIELIFDLFLLKNLVHFRGMKNLTRLKKMNLLSGEFKILFSKILQLNTVEEILDCIITDLEITDAEVLELQKEISNNTNL